jgi:hypothetical protein
MKRAIAAAGSVVVLACVAPVALGQDAGAAADTGAASLKLEHPLQKYVVSLEPMIWAPGLRGDIKLPGSSKIDVETTDADETQIAPMGRATIKADRLSFQLRGFGFSNEDSGRAGSAFTLDGAGIAAGTRVENDIEVYSFDATVGWELPAVIDNPTDEVRLAFAVTGGARVTSVDMSIAPSGGGGGSSLDNVWGMPTLGARMTLDLPHRLGLSVAGDVGWLPSDSEEAFSWDITVSFFWMALENIGIEIGFRHLQQDLEDGDGPGRGEFDASLAGLFGAVVIRF